jgi:hypothetical protein
MSETLPWLLFGSERGERGVLWERSALVADLAAGIVQDHAQYAHRAIGYGGRRDEGAPFLGGQVEAPALAVV